MRGVYKIASEVVTDARALAARDVDGAIALIESHRERFPQGAGFMYLAEMQLLAAAGRGADALGPFERALTAGCRYRKEWLTADPALAPLGELPGFADLVARSDRAYQQAAAAAKPHLTFLVPDTLPDAFGYPLLMVLHGNNSNMKETAPHWASMADKGWVVAVPQSTEVGMSPDAYTWNDREETATQLDLQLERVKRASEIDTSRIIIAGFSMGGLQAIALTLTKRIKARGFIAVAAWLPHIREFTTLVEGGAGKMLRAYVLVGEEDSSREGAAALVDLFTSHKLKAQLDLRAGLGHEYPEDMAETLPKALEFVTS
jgi:predicted esterase